MYRRETNTERTRTGCRAAFVGRRDSGSGNNRGNDRGRTYYKISLEVDERRRSLALRRRRGAWTAKIFN